MKATLDVVADAGRRVPVSCSPPNLRDLALEACSTAVVLRGGARVAAVEASELSGEAYRALLD